MEDGVLVGATGAVSREEIPLSEDQRAYLAQEISLGALARRLLVGAAKTPVVLAILVNGVTRLVTRFAARIPLIGWWVAMLLGIYGFAAAVAAACVGVLAIPAVFLITLPIALFDMRPKLRADLGNGTALRYSGSFQVKLGTRVSQLVCDDAVFYLDRADVRAIGPVLVDSGGSVFTLSGTIEQTVHCSTLLGVRDSTGQDLFTVGPQGGSWKPVAAPIPHLTSPNPS